MENTVDPKILELFTFYRHTVSRIYNDLQFWQDFLNRRIEEYRNTIMKNNNSVYVSIFCVYNVLFQSGDEALQLKCHPEEYKILSDDLEKHADAFFSWIKNSSIVKAYHACERFLLGTIASYFFKNIADPLKDESSLQKINNAIISYLSKECNQRYDTKNNRHIIQFVEKKSELVKSFLERDIRSDLKTNGKQFFEFISIMRNIILHNNSFASRNQINNMKSVAKDVFDRFIDMPPGSHEYIVLRIKNDQDLFSNLLILLNDFSINLVKYMLGYADLSFLDMN